MNQPEGEQQVETETENTHLHRGLDIAKSVESPRENVDHGKHQESGREPTQSRCRPMRRGCVKFSALKDQTHNRLREGKRYPRCYQIREREITQPLSKRAAKFRKFLFCGESRKRRQQESRKRDSKHTLRQ